MNLYMQPGFSLERLNTFREIVAAGSIAAAAGNDAQRETQFIRQLKDLERFFGVDLIQGKPDAVETTDAGQRLYEIITHTLGAMEDFRKTCAGQSLELVVGADESLIQWLLLPRLSGLGAAQPRLALTFQNLKADDIQQRLLDGSLDFAVVTLLEPNRVLASALLGKLDYCLFASAALLPPNPRLKLHEGILSQLPLALLEDGATVRQALEKKARDQGVKLNVRMRLSSYAQLAQAVQNLGVAAVMPKLAAAWLETAGVRALPLPFLTALSRPVSLVWNRRAAEMRPTIAKYSRLLPALFRMESGRAR
jgi:DNA-binding transcriptional LysR family regulator